MRGVRDALLAPTAVKAGYGAELFPGERIGRPPRRMEQSFHPPRAAAERAALKGWTNPARWGHHPPPCLS